MFNLIVTITFRKLFKKNTMVVLSDFITDLFIYAYTCICMYTVPGEKNGGKNTAYIFGHDDAIFANRAIVYIAKLVYLIFFKRQDVNNYCYYCLHLTLSCQNNAKSS